MIAINETSPLFLEKTPFSSQPLTAKPRLAIKPSLRKQGLDLFIAGTVLLFLLSWLVPIIALLIKLESRGPVFFKQLRTGKNGKPFYCFKFRSMYINEKSDTHQATRGDARITKIGAFIRKTSLDELPQFFNVLRMEMSIVGPRPHMIQHTEDYSKEVNSFMDRHMVKPGITGLAQISGCRGEISGPEAITKRFKFDIHYLHNWSFQLDLKIIALTFFQMIKGGDNVF
jgi:putative colanic acid biosynthesis UDP-glucose lipid carrier transferase